MAGDASAECDRRQSSTPPGPPLWLLLELTYRCPLHCVFCYNPTDSRARDRSSATDDWMRVLREARALGAVQLGLSGGEPLVRDDLEPIVAEAHALGFYTNLITSGVGLNESRITALKAAGLDHIQLSFQDSTREMNDFLSSTRTFELKSKVGRAHQALRLSDGAERRSAPAQHRPRRADSRHGASRWAPTTWSSPTRSTTAGRGSTASSCCPAASNCSAPRRRRSASAQRVGDRMKIYFVVPDYFERRPKPCMNGLGSVFLTIAPDGTALPCHAARMLPGLDVPERARCKHRVDLVRLAWLQPLSRRCMDEGAVPQLSREDQGLRRMPLPGLPAHG